MPRVSAMLDLPVLAAGIVVAPFRVEFLLDTGSGQSCLGPLDAIRAGIPLDVLASPSQWKLRREHRGIGGTADFYVVPGFFEFNDAEIGSRRFSSEIDVSPSRTDVFMPSVLGWDVLQHFAIRLDWSQRLVELT
jgi:hypothetical protein